MCSGVKFPVPDNRHLHIGEAHTAVEQALAHNFLSKTAPKLPVGIIAWSLAYFLSCSVPDLSCGATVDGVCVSWSGREAHRGSEELPVIEQVQASMLEHEPCYTLEHRSVFAITFDLPLEKQGLPACSGRQKLDHVGSFFSWLSFLGCHDRGI